MQWGSGITYFGSTTMKGREVSFGVKDRDRVDHLFVIGKEDTARSRLLTRLALQDIERGVGTIILDAGGNLTQLILERLTDDAKERLVFLDPSDGEFPFSWNPLEEFRALGDEKGIPLLAHAISCVYRAPPSRLAEFLAKSIFSDTEKTLVSVYDLVVDEKARKKAFDEEELSQMEKLMREDAKSVECITENGRYITKDNLVRNLVGQTDAKFSLEKLKEGGIFLIDFSHIRMFPTRVTPLVRLFMHAVHARAIKEQISVGAYLHECLRYLSEEDIEYLLPDRTLSFTVSDTIYSEEDRPLREKTLARASSVIAFPPHHLDFPITDRMFYPYVTSDELSKLDEGEFAIALSIDSVRSRPFFARMLPLPERTGSHQDLIGFSREKYTTSRMKVDQLFKKQSEKVPPPWKPQKRPDSFSNAFRSILSKQDKGGKTDSPAPSSVPPPPPKTPQQKVKETPAPAETKGGAGSPPEISEEELRQMLYVDSESS